MRYGVRMTKKNVHNINDNALIRRGYKSLTNHMISMRIFSKDTWHLQRNFRKFEILCDWKKFLWKFEVVLGRNGTSKKWKKKKMKTKKDFVIRTFARNSLPQFLSYGVVSSFFYIINLHFLQNKNHTQTQTQTITTGAIIFAELLRYNFFSIFLFFYQIKALEHFQFHFEIAISLISPRVSLFSLLLIVVIDKN